ncbi:MAG: alpha-glucosidase [Spirochaetaceae bacterium]|jgi:alpha-glucosidase|nr:alpha-glucosidase [Spirochaetaceae bacterium]
MTGVNMTTPWWQSAVFYQIYPRSFQDSNGDGIGDVPGVISRLDYIAGLGVSALWVSPFFKSPMVDFGYDISDYCDIDPLFGTMDDVKRLISEAHKRNIRIVFDLVINHTSDQHPWFIEARSSRDNPKHDWYLWTERKRRKPNNWVCQFELKSAWHDNDATDEWFLGTFTSHQPEVNWRNPELKKAMYEVIRFWLDLGVDGFRMDVVNWYIKDDELRSNPFSWNANPDIFQNHIYDRNRPETLDICRDIRSIADEYEGDRVLIGEIFTRQSEIAARYQGKGLLSLAFNMNLLYQKWNPRALSAALNRWYSLLPPDSWPNITLSNHDQPRHGKRYFSRNPHIQKKRCQIAAMLLLTARGTPFIYYGEELGMIGGHISKKEIVDPTGKTFWPLPIGRDPERTPMQWDDSANAGFTAEGVRPWLPLQSDYAEVNASVEQSDPASLWSWYRNLLSLRHDSAVLSKGGFVFLADGRDGVISYVRTAQERFSGYDGGSFGTSGSTRRKESYQVQPGDMLIFLNFSSKRKRAELPRPATVVLSNCVREQEKKTLEKILLEPYECLLLQL